MSDDLRHVFVSGRLPGLSRSQIAESLVKFGGTLVRQGGRASAVVLAHSSARAYLGQGTVMALPFERQAGAALISEQEFRRRLAMTGPEAPLADRPYTTLDVARLSGLEAEACRSLALFDVLAPVDGRHGYADVATARQLARLLVEGIPFASLVEAGVALARRGLRVSQVRLAAAPWGEVVQQLGPTIARLDGQFALVLDERTESAEASFAEARRSEVAGDLADAERHYGRAERLDKTDPVIPFNLGNVLTTQSRIPDAMLAFRRALARDHGFAEAAFNLARLLEGEQRDAEALAIYRATIAAHPAYAQPLFNAGRLLMRTGRHAEALPLWDRFLALAPDDPDAGQARRMALLCRLETRTGS